MSNIGKINNYGIQVKEFNNHRVVTLFIGYALYYMKVSIMLRREAEQ